MCPCKVGEGVERMSNLQSNAAATATDTLRQGSATNAFIVTGTDDEGDSLRTGSGNDRISTGAGDDDIRSGAGNDYVDAGVGNDDVYAGTGNDTVFGGRGQDDIYGQDGNDWLNGGADDDRIDGGLGNDLIWGESGNDTLFGDAGNDMLNGGSGNDILWGGADKDTFQFWLNNAEKNPNLANTWGQDTIKDFEAHDRIDLSSFWARFEDSVRKNFVDAVNFSVSGGGTNATGYTFNANPNNHAFTHDDKNTTLNLAQITTLGGEQYAITILSNDKLANVSEGTLTINISKMLGQDTVIEIDGVNSGTTYDWDKIFTADSQKVIHGTGVVWNDKKTFSTTGNDTISAANYDLNGKGAQMYGFAGNDALTGTTTADVIYGGDGSDIIRGLEGRDRLYGDAGNDILFGGAERDDLLGGADNDMLYGEADDDVLFGGSGNDILDGGAGNDTFLIGVKVDLNGDITFMGNTTVTDFVSGDKVRFVSEIVSWNLSDSTLNQSINALAGGVNYNSVTDIYKISDGTYTVTINQVDDADKSILDDLFTFIA